MYDTVKLGHFAELLTRDNDPSSEVLSWLSKAKNNRDIAQILGLFTTHRRQASRAD